MREQCDAAWRPRHRKVRRLFFASTLVCGLFVAKAAHRSAAFADPPATTQEDHDKAIRITTSNLKQIGQAMMLYAVDHDDKTPPTLGPLIDEIMSPQVFLVGGTTSTSPDNWEKLDTAAKAKWIDEHSDFTYIAAGQSIRKIADTFVVAYVKPDKSPEGNFFLLGDGSVSQQSGDAAKAIIAELKAGKNPPPSLK